MKKGVHVDVPGFISDEPYLPAAEIGCRLEVARHAAELEVDKEVALAHLYLLAFVVELYHSFSAEDDECVLLEYHIAIRRGVSVLHDHQIVTVANAKGVVTVSW